MPVPSLVPSLTPATHMCGYPTDTPEEPVLYGLLEASEVIRCTSWASNVASQRSSISRTGSLRTSTTKVAHQPRSLQHLPDQSSPDQDQMTQQLVLIEQGSRPSGNDDVPVCTMTITRLPSCAVHFTTTIVEYNGRFRSSPSTMLGPYNMANFNVYF